MSVWIIETLIATTALMLIVLLIRGTVARHFGARAAYLLWLAPALRMMMPPLPEEWGTAPGQQIQDAVIIMTGVSPPASMTLAASESGTFWPVLLAMLWLGGAALFFMRHIIAYRRFIRSTIDGIKPFETQGAIRISASPYVTSPLALGIIGKAIIIPHDFEARFDAVEQRLALAHELTHHRRGDPSANLFALAMLALHWFNPVAHMAHRAFRLDQEAACDAIVLSGATQCERHAYGSALFKAAIGTVPLAACAMGTATTLKARLKRITQHPQPRGFMRIGVFVAAIFVIAGVVLTASNGFAAKKVEQSRVNPQAILMGGVILDVATASADKAIAEAEAMVAEIDRDAEAAGKAAEEASEAAWKSHSNRAQADIARAKADIARANADLARTKADVARAETEAKMSPPDLPEPPAPPALPAIPGESGVSATPAAPSTVIAGKARCPEMTDRQEIRNVMRGPGLKSREFLIVVCVPSAKAIRNNVIEGLKAARATLAAEMTLGEEQRKRALEALDSRIASLSASRFTPQ